MTNNRLFDHCLICAIIVVTGLGLAFMLPLLAGAQGLAAQSEVAVQYNAPEASTIYYVAITGTGTAPELGWSTAFTNVQDALAVAVDPSEIWIAKGVYFPDVGSGQINNAVTSTFVMTDGVALYGGFDTSDAVLTDRDWENNVTVLSGDIDWDNGGMDITDENGVVIKTTDIISDNVYHIVSAKGVTGTAVLDGFTITGGKAGGPTFPDDKSGGGIYCDGEGSGHTCNPSLINLIFSGNKASFGGAMNNNGRNGGESNPTLLNVIFSGNLAEYGGAMWNDARENGTSTPELTNVTFSGNVATNDGGAMNNYGRNNGNSSPSLTNVTFSGNFADYGGAMYNDGAGGTSSPSLTNVTFSGNWADDGGAMFNASNLTGNSHPDIRNSILWNNQDSSGTSTITASIYNDNATITLTHSLVEGSGSSESGWLGGDSYVDGGNNIDEDPLFIEPISPTTAPTITGNLRLTKDSPAIDAGDNQYITVTVDLDNNAREVDGDADGTPTVDMGAYEYQIPYLFDGYIPLIFR